jgi:ribosome biogenesis GTPase A
MINEDKYCLGCGVKLQDSNMLMDGYTVDLNYDLCSRCFKLKNYGEYATTTKNNDEYIEILKDINETKDLVLYVVDVLNIEKDITMIRNYISNRIILVVTKRDVLPLSVSDEKIKEYFSKLGLEYQDIILISSNKNYNLDELFHMIKVNKSSKNVYVVGHTNVGKSALINKIVTNYTEEKHELTVSSLPSTTLNKVVIEISEDLNIIDTPGLVDSGNICNTVDPVELKRIHPKKEIKPRTHQVSEDQSLIIDKYARIDYLEGDRNSLTFFISNELDLGKVPTDRNNLLTDLSSNEIEVYVHQDLVINGLGFVKIVSGCKLRVYVNKDVEVFTRDSLI